MTGTFTTDRVGLTARNAVYVAFIGSGFSFASWASRIPQIRDALSATPSQLGLILLSVAAGSIIAMPLAGIVVNRIGAARAPRSWPACSASAWSCSPSATGSGCRRWWPGCS